MKEADFQRQVLRVANDYGWSLAYHTWSSFRSQPGFPDLFLGRMEPVARVLAIELKTDAKTSKVTPAQQAWIDCLNESGVEAHVFRPAQWNLIHEVLSRGTPFQPLLSSGEGASKYAQL